MWGTLSILIVAGSFLYMLYCSDPHARGIFSKLRRFFFITFPHGFKIYGKKILGNTIMNLIERLLKYVFDSPNPIVQIFYMILTWGGFTVFVLYGMMKHIPSPYVSTYHVFTCSFVSFLTFCSFFYLNIIDPGYISRRNYQTAFKKYPFDGFIFKKDLMCRTCKFIK